MTALLTDEEIVAESIIFSVNMRETVNAEEPTRMQAFEVGVSARSFSDGARFARSIYEARLAEVSQLRDQYQGDLIKVNAALDGHANEIIRLTARLAEAISLMKEAAPAIDTIAFGLSERFDRFLAVYAKEDKP